MPETAPSLTTGFQESARLSCCTMSLILPRVPVVITETCTEPCIKAYRQHSRNAVGTVHAKNIHNDLGEELSQAMPSKSSPCQKFQPAILKPGNQSLLIHPRPCAKTKLENQSALAMQITCNLVIRKYP